MNSPRVVLATASSLPHPESETDALAAAMNRRGFATAVWGWDEPNLPWHDVDIVIVRSTWNYLDHIEQFLAWTCRTDEVCQLLNDAKTVAWNMNKAYLLELESKGVPIVPTQLVTHVDTPLTVRGPIVIKPAMSAGARGTQRHLSSTAPEATSHLHALLESGPVLVQPYVAQIEAEGERSLMFFGGSFSHAVVKTPAPGDFRVQEHLGGMTRSYEPSQTERDVAEQVLRITRNLLEIPPLLYARVDLVPMESGPALVELELIEPYLYVAECGDPDGAIDNWCDAVSQRLRRH